MLCCKCNKNQAAKTYERIKNGESQIEYYCLDCYDRKFLYVEEAEGENSLSACPYCGTSKEVILTKKLVGCAHCYRMLAGVVLPLTVSMQNTREAHCGKTPPYLEEQLVPDNISYEYASKLRNQARFKRQCYELQSVIEKLLSDGDFDGAEEYQVKLKKMKEKSAIEEDFVWRQTSLSKQT